MELLKTVYGFFISNSEFNYQDCFGLQFCHNSFVLPKTKPPLSTLDYFAIWIVAFLFSIFSGSFYFPPIILYEIISMSNKINFWYCFLLSQIPDPVLYLIFKKHLLVPLFKKSPQNIPVLREDLLQALLLLCIWILSES